VGEHVAFEIRPDLTLHEPDDGRALPSRPSAEGFELLTNDFVEKGLLGFMAFVLNDGKESTGIVRWSALHARDPQEQVPCGGNCDERLQAERIDHPLWSDLFPIPRAAAMRSPWVHAFSGTARNPRCSLMHERDCLTKRNQSRQRVPPSTGARDQIRTGSSSPPASSR
jgi:hypothetical protein